MSITFYFWIIDSKILKSLATLGISCWCDLNVELKTRRTNRKKYLKQHIDRQYCSIRYLFRIFRKIGRLKEIQALNKFRNATLCVDGTYLLVWVRPIPRRVGKGNFTLSFCSAPTRYLQTNLIVAFNQ